MERKTFRVQRLQWNISHKEPTRKIACRSFCTQIQRKMHHFCLVPFKLFWKFLSLSCMCAVDVDSRHHDCCCWAPLFDPLRYYCAVDFFAHCSRFSHYSFMSHVILNNTKKKCAHKREQQRVIDLLSSMRVPTQM